MTTYKQVLVVRDDLGMSRGKLAAQTAHAAVNAVERADDEVVSTWNDEGFVKITLKATSEQELQEIAEQARSANLPMSLIADQGRTELPEGTQTVCGIGPARQSCIDSITGDLPLLK